MNANPLTKGTLTEEAVGIGEIRSEMLAARAEELALIAGHSVSKVDFERARRELTGRSAMDTPHALLDTITGDHH